ncbi:gamma-glutamylcyclotransferase family protein [Aquimarina hainanensis]|uniref:Gamma-glutamylcyclotransferase family protein n=1 Tax=Aquimarina hainanensis TaxID=1578017 RepID=A0ABW5N647_9FLAO|nr:gamma-glutamylcyclotransferase family protein [Aquimarina sp. TRL1]QKX03848.1 gamma-glutamylcyclotransferase [Aquimarina sp. TRL1]
MEKLFSYGTLQLEKVQLDTFGRRLTGTKEVLTNYRIETVKITDEAVIASSGIDEHLILKHSGQASDTVEGTLYEITEEELKHADAYEVDDYTRVKVSFRSGKEGWVYIGA